MTRDQLLAAEVFAYSFENYADHLGIGNLRYEKYMPEAVRNLARAEAEGWSDERLAAAMEMEVSDIPEWKKRYRDALEVVDARNPAEAFRNAVRQSLAREFEQRQILDAELESAVTQVCYRVSDLSYLLGQRNESLSKYSDELRREDD